jgi:hypothetical protein
MTKNTIIRTCVQTESQGLVLMLFFQVESDFRGPDNGQTRSYSGPEVGSGLVAPLEPLDLPLTQLQQTGGLAYAQPPTRRILNYFHPLELFLTHRHHP